jgi:hypothetical protein
MTIQERLQADLKEAMKAKERLRVQIIRDARAALQRAQQDADKARYDAARAEIVASGLSDNPADADESGRTPLARALDEMQIEPVPLTEEEQQDVLAREVKRRRDAAETYAQAGQTERQQQEESEAQVLETYLPQKLSAEELRPQVAAIIEQEGLSGPAAMGQLMPILIERFKGRADNRLLSQIARELLSRS